MGEKKGCIRLVGKAKEGIALFRRQTFEHKKIVAFEAENLKDKQRTLILTDYIRKDELNAEGRDIEAGKSGRAIRSYKADPKKTSNI